MRTVVYEHGTTIFSENVSGETFYMIKNGSVNIIKGGQLIRKSSKGDYFGERSILFNETRSASVIADGQVTCWELSKTEFLSIIDENIR